MEDTIKEKKNGRPKKSYKKDAEYWERRYTDLKESIKNPVKPILQSTTPQSEAKEATQKEVVLEKPNKTAPQILKESSSSLESEGSKVVKSAEGEGDDLTPSETQKETLEVSGTQKPEEAFTEAQQEKLGDNNGGNVNKCGECGAVVDSSLICSCGVDYND